VYIANEDKLEDAIAINRLRGLIVPPVCGGRAHSWRFLEAAEQRAIGSRPNSCDAGAELPCLIVLRMDGNSRNIKLKKLVMLAL
jgi:hypothetical protein